MSLLLHMADNVGMSPHVATPVSRRGPGGGRPLAVLLTLLGAIVALLFAAVPAQAAPGPPTPEEIGKGLRAQPVYVDKSARDRLSRSDQNALAKRIDAAGEPVFVVVLPKDPAYNKRTILSDIREATGRAGVYGVLLGDDFGAASDRALMNAGKARSLAAQAQGDGADAAALSTFAGEAASAVENGSGRAPADDNGSRGGSAGVGGLVIGVLLLGGLATALFFGVRSARRVRKEAAAELARVKTTVDEDVTSYGEELDRLELDPAAPGGASEEENASMVSEYGAALDAYEEAKSAMARVRAPRDVQAVTSALEQGRFALATLRARRAGEPLPEHRAPCFFDPRHGPSVEDREWSPEDGAPRSVPVCAADAARLDDGESPLAREVETATGRRPYWQAGPAYGPWAGGYFGAYGTTMMSGMLFGTLLGSSMGAGTAWGGDGSFDGGFDGGGFGSNDSFGGSDGGFGGGGGFDGGGGF